MLDTINPDATTAEAAPAVPYADEAGLDDASREVLRQTAAMLGVVPNAARTYMHRPDIAKVIHLLYGTIVLSELSNLDVGLKNKLGVICSSINGCRYCTSHQCSVAQTSTAFDAGSMRLSDDALLALISGRDEGSNDVEQVCFAFARAASFDPSSVDDALLHRMNRHLTPAQIVELGCVVSMWKFFNTMHDSLHIPSEGALAKYGDIIARGQTA